MFTIDKNSEAGRTLAAILADDSTYKVSLDYRPTARGGEFVAIKRNEEMWSPSLSTVTRNHPAHENNVCEDCGYPADDSMHGGGICYRLKNRENPSCL